MKKLFSIGILLLAAAWFAFGTSSSPPMPSPFTVFSISQGQDWKQYFRDEYYQLSYSMDLSNWVMISTTHTTPIANSFPKPAVWANFQLEAPVAFVKYKKLTRQEWLTLTATEQVTGAACDSYIVFKQ